MANEDFRQYHRQSPADLVGVIDTVTPIDQAWAIAHVGLIFRAIFQALGTTPFGIQQTLSQRLLDIEASAIWEVQDTAPLQPVRGKVWYNTSINELSVWNGNAWVEVDLGVGWISQDAAPDNPSDGTGWYDQANDQLKIYNGIVWVQVGGGNEEHGTHLPSGGSEGQVLSILGGNTVNWADRIIKSSQGVDTHVYLTQAQYDAMSDDDRPLASVFFIEEDV